MDEDYEYVETSDAEELEEAAALRRNSDPDINTVAKKRIKLCHPNVSPSNNPYSQTLPSTPNFSLPHSESQPQSLLQPLSSPRAESPAASSLYSLFNSSSSSPVSIIDPHFRTPSLSPQNLSQAHKAGIDIDTSSSFGQFSLVSRSVPQPTHHFQLPDNKSVDNNLEHLQHHLPLIPSILSIPAPNFQQSSNSLASEQPASPGNLINEPTPLPTPNLSPQPGQVSRNFDDVQGSSSPNAPSKLPSSSSTSEFQSRLHLNRNFDGSEDMQRNPLHDGLMREPSPLFTPDSPLQHIYGTFKDDSSHEIRMPHTSSPPLPASNDQSHHRQNFDNPETVLRSPSGDGEFLPLPVAIPLQNLNETPGGLDIEQHAPLDDDTLNASRYSLRKRKIAQLKPYTIDKYQYKQALSGNPEAIIHMREIFRMANDDYEEIHDPNALWRPSNHTNSYGNNEEMSKRNVSKHATDANVTLDNEIAYPGILQADVSTDDEETQEISKEAKEAERAETKRKREEKKRNGNSRPKHFPIRSSELSETGRLCTPAISSPPRSRSRSPTSLVPFDIPDEESIHDLSHPSFGSPSSDQGAILHFSPAATSNDRQQSSSVLHQSPPVPSDNESPAADLDSGDSDHGSDNSSIKSVNNSEMKHLKKQEKTLRKLYPHFMVKLLLSGSSSRSSRPQQNSRGSSSEEENPELLPGKSRTGWSKNAWNRQPIKGDTESSDELKSELESEVGIIRGSLSLHPDIVDLTRDSDDDDNYYDGVNDGEIEAYFNEGTLGGVAREESLIDWMLQRTRRVGGQGESKAIKANKSSSDKTIDITTLGARKERQTLLHFKNHTRKHTSKYSKSGQSSGRSKHRDEPTYNIETYDVRDQVDPVPESDNPERRKKGKERKSRDRRRQRARNGVYTFHSNDTRIFTGRGESAIITVDIEDDEFHRAIAPLSQNSPFQPAHRTNASHGPSLEAADPCSVDQVRRAKSKGPRYQHFHESFNLTYIPSGHSFGADTWIGKGWLYELLGVIRSKKPPPAPAVIVLRGIELNSSLDIPNFLNTLGRIFDDQISAITSLTGMGDPDDEREWLIIQRSSAQLLSYLLFTSSEAEASDLRDKVQQQVSSLVSRMRAQSLGAGSLDKFTLSICWFAVELSARLNPNVFVTVSSAFTQSASLLIDYLLEFGLENTMVPVLDETDLNGSTVDQYTAELWVSLFHILDIPRLEKTTHPFVIFLQNAWNTSSRTSKSKSLLETSETIWLSIFCLCILTQFSVHGITTGSSRLCGAWILVDYALAKIRLTANPKVDQELMPKTLRARDGYIGLVTRRCFCLWSKWKWQLNDTSTIITLIEIFRSRKFSGLQHEKAEYASFLHAGDWELIGKDDPRDSAFVLFLKLLVHSASCDTTNPNRLLSARAKKLLSLTLPVGSLPFSKSSSTAIQDLSMLYNRLSAIAVAIYLGPTLHATRISLARSYVNFSDANNTTRIAVIRGMMYLGILLKNAALSMQPIKDWIESMAAVLVNEHKSNQDRTNLSDTERRSSIISIDCLVGSVRQIIATYQASYPEPMLLCSLEPLMRSKLAESRTTSQAIRQLVQTFLNLRSKFLPPPRRPNAIHEDVIESQDEYGTLNIDYDDPQLAAALDGDISAVPLPSFADNENTVYSFITSRCLWWAYRTLSQRVADFKNNDYEQIDCWLDCWLGCADVLIRASKKSWSNFLDLTKRWQLANSSHRRRIDTAVMLRVLKLDPMSYLQYKDEYFGVLMMALVSMRPTLETEFVYLLLDIDGCQHPLLSGLNKADIENQQATKQKLVDILQTIIRNIGNRVRREEINRVPTSQETESYIGFCIKMFQAMKDNCSDTIAEPEARKGYLEWCQGVLRILDEHQELRAHQRLGHWKAWWQGLNES